MRKSAYSPRVSKPKLVDRLGAEHIKLPGFPQLVVTRTFAVKYFTDEGYDSKQIDYMVFNAREVDLPLTDSSERDKWLHLNRTRNPVKTAYNPRGVWRGSGRVLHDFSNGYMLYELDGKVYVARFDPMGILSIGDVDNFDDVYDYKRARMYDLGGYAWVVSLPWVNGNREFSFAKSTQLRLLEARPEQAASARRVGKVPQYKGYFIARHRTAFGGKYFVGRDSRIADSVEMADELADNSFKEKTTAQRWIDEHGDEQNPAFLPKSLFDRYEIRDGSTTLQADVQTLTGAHSALKKWAKKRPCSGLSIYSTKFKQVVESYKPANGRTPQIDSDNSKEYKREAAKATKEDTKYSLMIDGEHYADYDTEAEAKAVGRKEGKGKSVRVKAIRSNPRISGTKIVDMGNDLGLMTERSRFSGDLFYYPVKRGISHPDGKPFWHKVHTSTWGEPEYNFRNRASVVKFIKAQSKGGSARQVNPFYTLSFSGTQRFFINPSLKGETQVVSGRDNWPVEVLQSSGPQRNRRALVKVDMGEMPVYGWVDWSQLVSRGDSYTRNRNPSTGTSADLWRVASGKTQKRGGFNVTAWRVVKGHGVNMIEANGPSGKLLTFLSVESANRYADRLNGVRHNPETSADLFQTFHGAPSTREVIYESEEFERTNFAELGDLIELKVATNKGKEVVLSAPDPAKSDIDTIVKLASSPDGKSLALLGGDQEVDVSKFGLGSKDIKDLMVLGILTEITYQTRKGFHKMKTIDYYHQLGEETGVQPILLYSPQNESLSIAGGQYEVRDVGVVN